MQEFLAACARDTDCVAGLDCVAGACVAPARRLDDYTEEGKSAILNEV